MACRNCNGQIKAALEKEKLDIPVKYLRKIVAKP